MSEEKWQDIRNKVYAVAGSILAVLTTLGVIDQVGSGEALNYINTGLILIGNVIGLVIAVIAWIKSRAKKVAVLNVPSADISSIITTDGRVIAGPGNVMPTGTVLGNGAVDASRPEGDAAEPTA